MPCPPPEGLPDTGIKPASLTSPHWQACSLPLAPLGEPFSRPHLSVSSFPSRGPLPRGPLPSSVNHRPRLSSPTSPASGVSLLLPSGHCWARTFLGPGPCPLWSAHCPPRHLSCRCPRPRPEPPQTPFAHSRACASLRQGAEACRARRRPWPQCPAHRVCGAPLGRCWPARSTRRSGHLRQARAVRFPVGRAAGHGDLGLTLVHSQGSVGSFHLQTLCSRLGKQADGWPAGWCSSCRLGVHRRTERTDKHRRELGGC